MQWTCQLSSKQVLPPTGGVDSLSPGGSNFVSGGSSPPLRGGWINPCFLSSDTMAAGVLGAPGKLLMVVL